MPYDSTNFDYTKVTPVYDKDNPPKRMSEAIRMAVADVEAQERAGIKYEWDDCAQCTAGAVCRRVEPDWNGPNNWYHNGFLCAPGWNSVLKALSALTNPDSDDPLFHAWDEWPQGFTDFADVSDQKTYDYRADPEQWSTDMLALADRLEREGS